MADWLGNVSAYITVVSSVIAVFVIDIATLQYLTPTNLPLVVLGNILWVVAVVGGVFFYYNRRWPKVDQARAERLAIEYVESKYSAKSVDVKTSEHVGLKWRVLIYSDGIPRLLVIDAGTGSVKGDEVTDGV